MSRITKPVVQALAATTVLLSSLPVLAQEYVCQAPLGSNCSGSIPDGEGQIVSTLLVSSDDCNGQTAIKDVNVRIKLLHQNVGDLIATLTGPEGKSAIFLIRPGVSSEDFVGCAGDDIDATFSDQAPNRATDCGITIPALHDAVRSAGLLGIFNGTSRAGQWTLKIEDRRGLNKGYLFGWTLELPCELPFLSVQATDSAANVSGDVGTITFKRSGDTAKSLDVFYSVGGDAPATAYAALSGQLTIPAGDSSADVTITPTPGELAAPVNVVLTATAGEWATRGATSAKVTISPAPAASERPAVNNSAAKKSGCGCQSQGIPTELPLAILLGALWLRKRRPL